MNASSIKTLILFPFLLIFNFDLAVAQFVKKLIPDAAITQYAGSIGYFSVGLSYDIFKNKRGNIDVNFGFVPASKGGYMHIVATKFTYRPFVINIKNKLTIYPINPGLFLSYTFDNELSRSFSKDQYPRGYYYWSEAIRPHLSFSHELKFDTRKIWNNGLSAITIYSEFNSNDYYLVNYFQNTSSLKITDIFKLGIGAKIHF